MSNQCFQGKHESAMLDSVLLLGNKWIILDALPYLCDWGARSLIFKKEIIAQHVINVTSEQWPALCITPAVGVLLHLCDQLWLLTPHVGCLRPSIWKIKPLTLRGKNERACVKNTRGLVCVSSSEHFWVSIGQATKKQDKQDKGIVHKNKQFTHPHVPKPVGWLSSLEVVVLWKPQL